MIGELDTSDVAANGAYHITVTNGPGSANYPLVLNPWGGHIGIGTRHPNEPLHVSVGGGVAVKVGSLHSDPAIIAESNTGGTAAALRIQSAYTVFHSRLQGTVDIGTSASGGRFGTVYCGSVSQSSDATLKEHIAVSHALS